MKKLLLLFVAVSITQFCFVQVQWTYFPSRPVLSMDTSLMWAAYGQPTCVIHNDTFRMWYAVASGTTPMDTVPRGRIHYAWSTDGMHWTKHTGNPVLDIGGTGQWDCEWLDTPEILWDGQEFKLYYYGDSTYFQGQNNTAIGLAVSADGIKWTRQGKVLSRGAPGEWDGKFIESPAAYYDPSSGIYAMWYTGIDTIGYTTIGLAVSPDGMNWSKDPANPGITVGTFGEWDDMFAAVPAVIESNGIFEMWYSGVNYADQWDSVPVGYATSLNGSDWIKYPGNPVLVLQAGDSGGFWAVDVVWDSLLNEYKMYYENDYLAGAGAIYYATAPRSILFSSNCSTTVCDDKAIVEGNSVELSAGGGEYYQWYPDYALSDPNIPNPVATPDTSVTYTVMIVSDSCITTDSVTVTIHPVSVPSESSGENRIKVYPNPVLDHATVEFSNPEGLNYNLNIYNHVGQLVRSLSNLSSERIRIEKEELAVGIYLIELRNAREIIGMAKIIVD